MSNKIIVIGGGAAGMAAAISASGDSDVTILEKNEKLGKKIYITGKGRCNCTNNTPMEDYPGFFISNPKFTYSAFKRFSNNDLIEFLEENGTRCKVERGNRVFPVSDHASDVTKAFEKALKKNNVHIRLNTEVSGIVTEDYPDDEGDSKRKISGVRLSNGQEISADAVIVATGGKSYPTTGSTGDGYIFAKETGHKVTTLRPSLVRLVLDEDFSSLEGLSLKNVELHITFGKKKNYSERGEMLFTDDGISGPLVLTASAYAGKYLEEGKLKGYIDFKPALTEEKLRDRVLRDFEARINMDIKNAMGSLLPSGLILEFLKKAGIEPDKKIHDITKAERNRIIYVLKHFEFNVKGTGSFKEAIVTQGGVSVKDVNPSTMESRRVKNLYFCGEVMDVDGVTGGFNLQYAFSSGFLAGDNAKKQENE